MEQLQSHMRGRASLYMRKCANISPYMRRPLVIYDFATAPFWISLYMRKIWFSFLFFLLPKPAHKFIYCSIRIYYLVFTGNYSQNQLKQYLDIPKFVFDFYVSSFIFFGPRCSSINLLSFFFITKGKVTDYLEAIWPEDKNKKLKKTRTETFRNRGRHKKCKYAFG